MRDPEGSSAATGVHETAPRFIDISMPLSRNSITWPGSCGVRVDRVQSIEAGDSANVSRLDCDVHVGTHIENSLHFVRNGRPIDAIPIETLIGPAFVAHISEAPSVGRAELEAAGIPGDVTRLLLRTRNSKRALALSTQFRDDYTGLTCEGALWVVERGIELVGIDYLSIAAFAEIEETHHALMRHDVAILEGLDLSPVHSGRYELICLPLSLPGAEAAPARAVLRRL